MFLAGGGLGVGGSIGEIYYIGGNAHRVLAHTQSPTIEFRERDVKITPHRICRELTRRPKDRAVETFRNLGPVIVCFFFFDIARSSERQPPRCCWSSRAAESGFEDVRKDEWLVGGIRDVWSKTYYDIMGKMMLFFLSCIHCYLRQGML